MIKYYYSSTSNPYASDSNRGLLEVQDEITRFSKLGKIELVDTSPWTAGVRFDTYGDAIVVSVKKKSKIRRIYGTNRYPAINFGKEVPSLIIYNNEGYPIDAYPREENGIVLTIKSFLDPANLEENAF